MQSRQRSLDQRRKATILSVCVFLGLWTQIWLCWELDMLNRKLKKGWWPFTSIKGPRVKIIYWNKMGYNIHMYVLSWMKWLKNTTTVEFSLAHSKQRQLGLTGGGHAVFHDSLLRMWYHDITAGRREIWDQPGSWYKNRDSMLVIDQQYMYLFMSNVLSHHWIANNIWHRPYKNKISRRSEGDLIFEISSSQ